MEDPYLPQYNYYSTDTDVSSHHDDQNLDMIEKRTTEKRKKFILIVLSLVSRYLKKKRIKYDIFFT